MIDRRTMLAMAGTLLVAPRVARGQTLEKVSFRFNWSWVANYAPVILGRERGYFKDLGIDLVVGQGKGSGATVRQAGAKNDMFVWADTAALLVAGAQSVPIKAIMVMAYSNLAVVWIEGRVNVRSPNDLIGKRFSATPGDGNTQMWPAVLAANNIKPSDIDMVYMDGAAAVAALREGRVDIMLGSASDQAVTLRTAGVPARATMFAELGVPTLGSGVITHVDTIAQRPDLCRKIVAGVQKSWEAALQDPEAAIKALMNVSEVPLNEQVLRDGLKVFTGLLTKKQPMGRVEPSEMDRTLEFLKQYGGIKTDRPATAFYTNEFVEKA